MRGRKINAECKFDGIKGDELSYRYRECKIECQRPIKPLIRKFPSVYQFCKGDLNKFLLLLRKGVYPHEDMDNWGKFDETTLPPKEAFYSKLNLEGIRDADYEHAQKVWEVFGIKYCSEYHDSYAKSYTLLLADVFDDFKNICLEIYELDPTYFVSAPGLAWQACLKKAGAELELLTDYDMLLMVEKGIRSRICLAKHRYAKANNKYMNNYDKKIDSSYVEHLDANNLYGWAMSQKLPVDGFEWVKILSKFNEDFIKNYDENSDKGYFLEIDVEYPKTLFSSHKDLPFLQGKKKKKLEKLICSIEDKKNVVLIRALNTSTKLWLKIKKSTQSDSF